MDRMASIVYVLNDVRPTINACSDSKRKSKLSTGMIDSRNRFKLCCNVRLLFDGNYGYFATIFQRRTLYSDFCISVFLQDPLISKMIVVFFTMVGEEVG